MWDTYVVRADGVRYKGRRCTLPAVTTENNKRQNRTKVCKRANCTIVLYTITDCHAASHRIPTFCSAFTMSVSHNTPRRFSIITP